MVTGLLMMLRCVPYGNRQVFLVKLRCVLYGDIVGRRKGR